MIEVKAYQDSAGHNPYAEWIANGLTDKQAKSPHSGASQPYGCW